jgi:APA family basic amino acid/polyamine antiporter
MRRMPSAPRQLGLLDATLLVMGGIVGVGIFYTPRLVAQHVPHPTAFLAMWAIGGLIALAGALTFAELGATFPKAGGWYVFLREAFGPFVAYLFAWVVLCVISTGATSVMVRVLVQSVPGLPASAHLAVGAATIALVTGLAMLGAKAGATLQNACMAIKLAAIAAMAGVGLLFAAPAPTPAAPVPIPPGGLALGMVRAVLPVLFACGGWQMLCYVAPEVRDPQRTLPRAIVIGILAVVATYLAIDAAYLRVLGIEGLIADPAFASEMARRTLGGAGGEILRGAMAVSALGVCIVTLVATPWLYVAMAREGLFFARFAEVHPKTGAPIAALLIQGGLALAYWFWGQADLLVDSVVFVEWIFHLLVAVALLRLRARRPDLPRPFASPLYPLAPVLYALLAAAVVAGTLAQAEPKTSAIGLGVLAVAAAVYLPWRRLVRA